MVSQPENQFAFLYRWHKSNAVSYILDFEIYRKPVDEDTWDDSLYLSWGLAWVDEGDPDDMSTWEL